MTKRAETLSIYTLGEDFVLHLQARDRQGGIIAPAAADVTLAIAAACGQPALIEVSGSPGVVQLDAGEGLYELRIARAELAQLTAGRRYRYDIWTDLAGDDRLHQAGGALILHCAVQPAD